MSYFFCRLVPPRPSFPMDMTNAEREVMQKHSAYWRGMLAEGKAIAFGPVMDPKGGWGMGVLEVRDEKELAELQAGDPALTLGMRYESFPMPAVVHR